MKLIEKIKKILGNDIKKNGSGFYSSIETIKKGKYLILGLNPGGDPVNFNKTIEQTISDWLKIPDYNAYYEDWGEKEKPARLQKNLQSIFEYLNTDLRSVCATNLFWERTKKESDLTFTSFPKYKKLIELILSEIDPQIIITFGNKPFSTISTLKGIEPIISSIQSGHGNWKIQLAQLNYSNKKIKIIGFPHLSRYTIYNRDVQLKMVKEFILK